MTQKSISVAYSLFFTNAEGRQELAEQATKEHPFSFITGMGFCLDAFEQHLADLAAGDAFDFSLSVEEAYGPYIQEAVQSVEIKTFFPDGRLDKEVIYPGAIIPLQDAEGHRFQGTVTDVSPTHVTIDLNHPLAGKPLRFVGSIVSTHDATNEEIETLINLMSHEGCSCGCGEEGCDCGGDHDHCGKHHGDGGEHHGGCHKH